MQLVGGQNCVVQDVQTKGKFMYWTFSNNWNMFCTFGMSGQWSPTVGKHPCFSLHFEDGSTIYFNDPRHFGTLKFTKDPKALTEKLNELGWDPLARAWEEYRPYVLGQLKYSPKSIGDVLMDQKIFAGVGNYIRAEALYEAVISPWRAASTLTEDEIDRLSQAIVKVMKESYDHQGATILTYKDAYGAEGKYSSCFKVYGKKQDPSGRVVKKETMPDGRSIHWCPEIQR